MPIKTDHLNVDDVRDALLSGTTDIETLAAALNCSVRTVQRMVQRGLPVIYVNGAPRFNIERCRAWIMPDKEPSRAPRRPGRPAKKRVAWKPPRRAAPGRNRHDLSGGN